MPTPPAATPNASRIGALAAELERILDALVAEHERLLELAQAHRRALAASDRAQLEPVLVLQRDVLGAIHALEERRRSAAGALAGALGLVPANAQGPRGAPADRPAEARVTITRLVAALPDPHRTRLAESGARLRDRLDRLAVASRTLRAATTALLAHMDGIVRQVGRALSHSGAYTPHAAPAPAVLASALDLTT